MIREILHQHKMGKAVGIYSICSSHPFVLRAAMRQALRDNSHLLIESTSNQVDQFGGYTGQTPAQFIAMVREIAQSEKLLADRLIFGGDHLGPNVWQREPATSAMGKARDQIAAYVAAGYRKIHLDTSMRCADDPGGAHSPLAPETIAERAAELCEISEKAFREAAAGDMPPVYIIGTEVPIPGGAQEALSDLAITTPQNARATIEITQKAFYARNLHDAWQRVIGVVVQPGVEFGDDTVVDYHRAKAAELSALIEQYPGLVFEAHSTDYQSRANLRELVEDHFAILKVGPWLTFAMREALFALEMMEQQWLSGSKSVQLSRLREVLNGVMRHQPKYWQHHYHGSDAAIDYALMFSYSDRIRYYWPMPEVQQAIGQLIANLTSHPLPLTLISQFLPTQYQHLREQLITNSPVDIIIDKIMQVTEIYAFATAAANGTAIVTHVNRGENL